MPETRFFCAVCGTALKAAAGSADDLVECPSCSCVVPVPSRVKIGCTAAGAHVFPPDVLAVEVKFRCGGCKSKLRADGRWEGRSIKCPECGAKLSVPRWSSAAVEESPSLRDALAPLATAMPCLSSAEVEFLSEPADVRPKLAC
jgi:DNA-directed RNA polymerase subunit RPC12/RpoP